MTIRGVLLDSGGVLIQPRGGRWNPRFDFEEIISRCEPHVSPVAVAEAISEGQRFLDACTATPDYDDFHRVILGALAIEPISQLLAELRSPLDPSLIVEVFLDVAPTLAELRERGIKMAVVSDAWEGLDRVHRDLGIGDYFDAYAISQVLGCCKPDPRMYRHASDALGLTAAECLFVDDSPDLVSAAMELGYEGVALLRNGGEPEPTVPTIGSLGELVGIL